MRSIRTVSFSFPKISRNRCRAYPSGTGSRDNSTSWDGSLHGWYLPDMPLQNGKRIYDVADADRAWGKLVTPVQSGAELTGICINNTNADST